MNKSTEIKVEDDGVSSFTDGVVPPISTVELQLKKYFLPWHKPRKQWLRTHQWNKSIFDLAHDLKLADQGRPLTYLSLPGQDLLDIRDLSTGCEKSNITLKFLGLNYIDPQDPKARQKQVEQDLSRNEVLGLVGIDRNSFVINEKLEDISRKDSITYDKLLNSQDTFDVVNIDLCNSFGKGSPADSKDNLYDALYNIFAKQAENRGEDWLFFLTTRNNTAQVHPEVWKIFVNIINERAALDPQFLPSLVQRKIIDECAVLNNSLQYDRMTRKCHVGIFGTSIGFWIADVMMALRPAWRVSMLPSYGYHVYLDPSDQSCDMISLAFRIEKIRIKPEDPHNLSRNLAGEFVDPEKCRAEIEEKILEEHCHQTDLDLMLDRDRFSYEEAFRRSTELLRLARYDIDNHTRQLEIEMAKLRDYLRAAGLHHEHERSSLSANI